MGEIQAFDYQQELRHLQDDIGASNSYSYNRQRELEIENTSLYLRLSVLEELVANIINHIGTLPTKPKVPKTEPEVIAVCWVMTIENIELVSFDCTLWLENVSNQQLQNLIGVEILNNNTSKDICLYYKDFYTKKLFVEGQQEKDFNPSVKINQQQLVRWLKNNRPKITISPQTPTNQEPLTGNNLPI